MKFLKLLALVLLFFACQNERKKFEINEAYTAEIESFFKAKMEERQGDYLQLVGLHKLDISNSFGKDSTNNIVVNSENLPDTIGLIFTHPSSFFVSHNGVLVKDKNDSIVSNYTLNYDKYGSSEKLFHEHLIWRVITRSGQKYLRVWDTQSPKIKSFKGFERFSLNSDYIIEGNFKYFEKEKSEVVKAKVDGHRKVSFIGKATFEFQGKSYSLDIGPGGFTMVGDVTNGETTYGGGRYFYLDLPKENGLVKIDFNKLYNPPCAFSEFTTCLYPPRQNQLSFAIMAGETITQKQ
jgi:uncharacterized protein (DUF1684 family)